MKALMFRARGQMVYEEIPSPEPGPGEVLLDVIACGICGSDLEGYMGTPGMAARRVPPLLLGHEFVGRVRQGPQEWVGRVVAVYPLVTCNACRYCRSGRQHLCPRRELIGLHRPGAFAEQVVVPLDRLFPLLDGIPPWRGALAEPLAVAWHALTLAGPLLGQEVCVVGGGAIGFLCAWLARRSGAHVQVVEIHPGRQTYLRSKAFAVTTALEDEVDVVIDTVGLEATRRQALQAVVPGGTVVFVGLHDDETSLPMYPVILGERRVQGSYAYAMDDFAHAVNLVGEIPDDFVARWPLARGAEAFARLAKGEAPAVKILLEPDHEA